MEAEVIHSSASEHAPPPTNTSQRGRLKLSVRDRLTKAREARRTFWPRLCQASRTRVRPWHTLALKACERVSVETIGARRWAWWRKGCKACVQPMDGGTGVLKKLEEAVVAATSAEIRTKSALPKASWAVKVFEMEVIGTNSGYATASWSPYGMMSAIMVLEGNVAFFGVPTNKVEGDSYADKRATIFRSTIDDLNQYLLPSVGGFYVRFEGASGPNGESVIVVPSGFLIAYAASNVRFLRWALVADQADAARVKVALKNILQSFSEYNAPDLAYRPLAENLGINLNT